MRSIGRRESLAIPLLVGLAVSSKPREAKADIWGVDVGVLAAILTQSIATVTNLISMVNAIRSQIVMMERMLSHLDVQSFSDVVNLVKSGQQAYRMLTNDVRSIQYTMASVEAAYHKIFPSDVSNKKPAELRPLTRAWHQETLGAALVAHRAQTSLSTLEDNTNQAAAVLARSQNADGEVAQLQAVNQMLGIISSQLNTVISALDTTGRVTAAAAATTAAEHVVSFEKKDRDLTDYTDTGDRVPVMTKLPDPY